MDGRYNLLNKGKTMSTNQAPLLLTVKEVSLLLRIHRPKVYDLIKDRTIEGFKLGSDWRVKRESIEKLIGPIPADFFQNNKLAAKGAKAGDAEEGGGDDDDLDLRVA